MDRMPETTKGLYFGCLFLEEPRASRQEMATRSAGARNRSVVTVAGGERVVKAGSKSRLLLKLPKRRRVPD